MTKFCSGKTKPQWHYENIKICFQNMLHSACRLAQIPFYRGYFNSQKGSGTSFQATFFAEFFDKNLSFVISEKLAKFYYQTVYFPSHIVQRGISTPHNN